jgi:hypothetical protein
VNHEDADGASVGLFREGGATVLVDEAGVVDLFNLLHRR